MRLVYSRLRRATFRERWTPLRRSRCGGYLSRRNILQRSGLCGDEGGLMRWIGRRLSLLPAMALHRQPLSR